MRAPHDRGEPGRDVEDAQGELEDHQRRGQVRRDHDGAPSDPPGRRRRRQHERGDHHRPPPVQHVEEGSRIREDDRRTAAEREVRARRPRAARRDVAPDEDQDVGGRGRAPDQLPERGGAGGRGNRLPQRSDRLHEDRGEEELGHAEVDGHQQWREPELDGEGPEADLDGDDGEDPQGGRARARNHRPDPECGEGGHQGEEAHPRCRQPVGVLDQHGALERRDKPAVTERPIRARQAGAAEPNQPAEEDEQVHPDGGGEREGPVGSHRGASFDARRISLLSRHAG